MWRPNVVAGIPGGWAKREAKATCDADEGANGSVRVACGVGGGAEAMHGMVTVSKVPAIEEG
jgi:hypothetical protein